MTRTPQTSNQPNGASARHSVWRWVRLSVSLMCGRGDRLVEGLSFCYGATTGAAGALMAWHIAGGSNWLLLAAGVMLLASRYWWAWLPPKGYPDVHGRTDNTVTRASPTLAKLWRPDEPNAEVRHGRGK